MGTRIAIWALSAHLWTGCASTSEHKLDKKTAPEITQDMPIDDALKAGVDYGGQTIRDVRKLITKRKEWPSAEKLLVEAIRDGVIKYENAQLANAMMIYVSGPVTPNRSLFKTMVESGRPFARQLGWQMAAALPSKTMQQAIDYELNRALLDGEEKAVLLPQMAAAAQSNRMTSAYSLVREGLFQVGHEDFAMAMATLNPQQATVDFVDYLATCPPEELRQITVNSINVYAATAALNHLIKNTPKHSHPQIEALFFYAISRNPGLSDLAMNIVDALASNDQRSTAISLSRLPSWAQIAFIESSRRSMSANRRVFLGELKSVTAQSEVLEELGEIKL
jgi:hypothetical protein